MGHYNVHGVGSNFIIQLEGRHFALSNATTETKTKTASSHSMRNILTLLLEQIKLENIFPVIRTVWNDDIGLQFLHSMFIARICMVVYYTYKDTKHIGLKKITNTSNRF